MAIWPFGRKGKRPRSQITGPESTDKTTLFSSSPHAPEHPSSLVGRKPSRKRSKRDKSHVATRGSDADFGYLSSPVPVPQAPPWLERGRSSSGAPPEPMLIRGPRGDHPSLSFWDHPENHASLSSLDQDQTLRSMRRLQKRRTDPEKEGGGPWRRLSKRSARDLAREQEILLLSSSPPSDLVRSASKRHTGDGRRGPGTLSRHDRHVSVLSLTMRDSARSSMSEGSDSGTFKIHGLAIFTPHPALRYAETPRYVVPRSQGPSAASEKQPMWQNQDGSSKKRVAELADDLDAPALRELLERDRRRKEKKRQEEQERLQRRLQRRADRQREEERRAAARSRSAQPAGDDRMVEGEEEWRGRSRLADPSIPSSTGAPDFVADVQHHPDPIQDSRAPSEPKAEAGSWLRDSSRESHRMSDGSTRVIGTLDNRSIRGSHSGNLGAHDSGVAWSPERKASHDTYSRSQGSLSASQIFGGRGSTSDISRTGDSDRRMSDASGKRQAWSSFFRRASLRRKKKSIDQGRAPASDFSNTSRESFSRLQSQPGPPPPIPERNFIRTSGLRHTQSKFTEHLGDHPISPTDSHMQSPTLGVPDSVDRSPDPDEMNLDERDSRTSPISFSNAERDGERSSRHRSWETNSPRASPENAFSQSLASIDSEGSWMSGKFLRHLSQTANNSVRRSGGSTTNKTDPVDENGEFQEGDDVTSDEYLARLATGTQEQPRDSPTELRRASSGAIGPDCDQRSGMSPLPDSVHDNKQEKRGFENGRRRPKLVRPGMQPQPPEDVTMKRASPDSYTTSPTEEGTPVEIQRATSIDFGRQHARRISAGSAKLLDIPARASIDLKALSADSTVVGDILESDHLLGE